MHFFCSFFVFLHADRISREQYVSCILRCVPAERDSWASSLLGHPLQNGEGYVERSSQQCLHSNQLCKLLGSSNVWKSVADRTPRSILGDDIGIGPGPREAIMLMIEKLMPLIRRSVMRQPGPSIRGANFFRILNCIDG